MSRSASAAPRSPATVEKRTNASVSAPGWSTFAFVYALMSPVTLNVPYAPEPFACMRRSGMTSRSKCASFSIIQLSWSIRGPRSFAVRVCCYRDELPTSFVSFVVSNSLAMV